MAKKNTYRLRTVISTLVVLFVVLVASLVSLIQSNNQTATAAGSTYLNFQARLKNSAGAVVPDGDYNIEFKLYDAATSSGSSQGSCTGDSNCLWTETRTSGNKVRVANGYMTVNLGSVTAFPSTINWGEQLWITMNIGGSGSPSWDGEMDPRLRLTAVPLAFKANNVGSGNTNSASTNTNNVTITTGNASGSTSNSGNILIDNGTATGTVGTISLGASNASAITLGRAGLTVTVVGNQVVQGGTLTVGTTSQAGNLVISDGSSNTGTIQTAALGSDEIYILPDSDGSDTICLQDLANCGGVGSGVTTVGAIDSQTKHVNGAVISGTTIYLQTADIDDVGLVSIGAQTFNGVKTFDDGIVLAANQTLTVTGGTTANRPGSPTEGMVYFDTDTDQLLTYANGKWQADRNEAVLVAATDSSDADKAAADFIADGTDDQVQINAALTVASSSGSRKTGRVFLFAGTYTTHRTDNSDATIYIPNNVTLAGAGQGTVIKLGDTVDTTDNLIENTDTATGTGVVIRDLTIDGQDSLQSAGTQYGILFSGMGAGTGASARQGGQILNIFAKDFRNDGIRISGSLNNTVSGNFAQGNGAAGITLTSFSHNNIITNNNVQGNTQYGINFSFSSDNTITGNTAQGNSSAGMFISNSSNNTITGNTMQGNTSYGLFLNSSSQNSITANDVKNNGTNGISISSSSNYNQVSSNSISNNGGTSGNSGIYIEGSDFNQITSNTITDTQCDTTCEAILIADSPSDKNYLADNYISDTDATYDDEATISDSGTGTIYGNQMTPAETLQSSSSIIRASNSRTLTGTANPTASTTLNGTSTSTRFVAELQVGDRITINGETRTVVSITDNDTLVVDTAFTDTADAAITRLPAALIVKNSSGTNTVLINDIGQASFRNSTDSTTGFMIQNAAGTNVFSVNTSTAGATVSGTLTVTGNSSFEGNVTLGDATSDDIVFTGYVASNILPKTDDTYTLGDDTHRWADIFLGPSTMHIGTSTSDEGALSYNTTTNVLSIQSTGGVAIPIDNDTNLSVSGTITDSAAAQSISITLGDDGAGDTVAGLNITATTANTGDADILQGINIADLASPQSVTERALQIGSGWDTNLFFNDTTTSIQVVDAGAITFEDDGGNDLVVITDAGTTGILTVTGNTTVQGGTATLGTTGQAGTLVISDGSSNTVSLTASGVGSDYSLTLPTVAGGTDQCLKTDSITASQLVFGSCGAGASPTLQGAYTNDVDGSDAIILLTATDGAIVVRDAASTITTLFVVEANGGSDYFSVTDTMVTAGGDLTVSGGEINITGIASSASTTEGTVYYDTDTDRLLVYSNGKWQADRSDAVLVAASNSSQADKDSADYVADGTGDQTEINNALTAASGKKVVLLAGTYVANATILVPNNTILTGVGNGTVIELADIDTTDNLIEATGASRTGQVIRDMKLDGRNDLNTAGTQSAISLFQVGSGSSRSGAIVSGLTITRFRNYAIYIEENENTSITGNTSLLNNSTNIYVVESSNNSVTSNYIYLNNGANAGITILGSVSFTSDNNTVSGNIIEGNSNGYGVTISNFTNRNNLVTDNVFNNLTRAFDTNGGNHNIFSSNSINTTASSAIQITGDYYIVQDNTIIDAALNGISLGSSNYALVSGNRIHNSGGSGADDGINVSGSNHQIIANYITDTAGTGSAIQLLGSNNYLSDNHYSGTGANSISDGGSNNIFADHQTSLKVLQSSSTYIRASAIVELTGDIDPDGTATVTGTSTLFTIELQVGDRITVGAETRTITAIATNTSLTVDSAFSNAANDTTPQKLPPALRVANSSGTTMFNMNDVGTTYFRNSTDSTTGFMIQNAAGTNVVVVDTTNSELEVGSASTAGKLVLSDGSSNTGTIQTAALGSDEVYLLPDSDGSDTICLLDLANCGGASPFTSSGGVITKTTSTDKLQVTVGEAGDYGLLVDTSLAPTVDILQVSNSGFASATSGVDGLTINFSASNASGDALHIIPSFAGGATDALTYNVFEIDAFSPTNAAGSDNVNGLKIGDLTDPGSTINSTGINLGTGWDTGININGINNSGNAILVNTGSSDASGLYISSGSGVAIGVESQVAPTYDLVRISNAGFASNTQLVDGLSISFRSSEASGSGLHITPAYAGGSGSNGIVYNGIEIDGFSPTNTGGTDTVNGLLIGTLTDPGSVISSNGINIGSGWDKGITIAGVNASGVGVDITTNGASGIGLNITGGTGSFIQATAQQAPGSDLVILTNSSNPSTTTGVDGISLSFSSSNASGDALHITPSFAGGATDTLTYNGIELDAFSPTNASGTDTVNGLKIGNLTDPGATITSNGITIGTGWDTGLAISQGTSGAGLAITATGAPAADMASITNSGQASTTSGVDGLSITFGTSNASGDALRITPSFAGGATDALTYNGLEIVGFSPTNGAGTDTVNGIKIGNMTDPGATITSRGLDLGTGWDTSIYSSGNITFGGTSTGTSATQLVLPTKTDSGDPTTTQTNGGMYYNSNAGKFRCYENSTWKDCISSGGTTTLQTAYDNDTDTGDAIINLTSADGAIKIRDTSGGLGTDLFSVQNNGGTATYLGVSAAGIAMQDGSGNSALYFDSTTSELRIYENVASPTRYLRMYYDTANNVAVYGASSGTTQIGTGSGAGGDINLSLTGAQGDKLTANKQFSVTSGYSGTDFNFVRNLTGTTYALTGSVLKVEDTSSFTSGSSAPNILYLNQNNTGATGNLILAQTGGATDKFKVDTTGLMTLYGSTDITSGTNEALTITANGTGDITLSGDSDTDVVFSGFTTDITTGSNEALTITPNGTGDTIFSLDADTNVQFTSTAAPGVDMLVLTNSGFASTTSGVDGLAINFIADNASGAGMRITPGFAGGANNGLTYAGIEIDTFSPTNGAGADTVHGLLINGITDPGSTITSYGLRVTSGYDTGISVTSVVDRDGIQVLGSGMAGTVNNGAINITYTFNDDGNSLGHGNAIRVVINNSSDDADTLYGIYLTGTTSGTATETGLYVDTWDVGVNLNATTDITTSSNTALTIAPNGTGNVVFADGSAPTSDFISIVSDGATTTNGVNGVQIDFTTGDGTNPTNSGLQINLVSGGTAAGDIINGINLTMDAADSSTQNAIVIGSNFDTILDTANLDISGAGEITGATGITSSGTITFSGLTNCGSLTTNGSGVLTCGSGQPQVKQASGSGSTALSTSESALTSVSITPTSSSNEILIMAKLTARSGTTADRTTTLRIRRGADCTATQVGTDASSFSTNSSGDDYIDIFSSRIDAPATTSSTTYQLCARADNTSITATYWDITVMEVNQGADYAEIYNTNDTSLEPGDVVVQDSLLPSGVMKSTKAYDSQVFGIVSTRPGQIVGGGDRAGANAVPIALNGRVPVKVNTENGQIKAGDLLTSSSTPGVAMRATKAGQIVGQAMTSFSGEGVGKVMAFVKTDYGNGISLDELLVSFNFGEDENSTEYNNFSVSLLEGLISLNDQQYGVSDSSISDILADRIAAGIELVTPKVTTDELLANTIKVATGANIKMALSLDGKFVIEDLNGEEVISFDAEGNARFSGTLTAHKIKAEEIEGLNILTDKITSLYDQVVAGETEGESNSEGTVAGANTSGIVNFGSPLASLDVSVLGTLTANGALVVHGDATFNGLVNFVGRTNFNNDSGGFAVIHGTQQEVEVRFVKVYDTAPSIGLTIKNGKFAKYSYHEVKNDDEESPDFNKVIGFKIVLEQAATEDIEFAWTAFGIIDAQTTQVALPPVTQP